MSYFTYHKKGTEPPTCLSVRGFNAVFGSDCKIEHVNMCAYHNITAVTDGHIGSACLFFNVLKERKK